MADQIKYDEKYFNNLNKIHEKTEEKISKIRWDFASCVPFETVLDYGCGCGELSKYAPKRDDIVIDSYDIGEINGSPYPQTGMKREFYDIIFLNDVIEHVDWANNPDLNMEERIKKSKYVYVTIPVWNFEGDIKKWRHYKPGEHLTYFSEKDISDFFSIRGFVKIKSGYPECPPREDVFTAIFKNTSFLNKKKDNFIEKLSLAQEKAKQKNNNLNYRKIILKQKQSLGDVITFTRSVIDFKQSFPKWDIDVRVPCPEVFQNCPYLTPLSEEDKDVEIFDIEYPDINNSGWSGIHYSDAFRKDIERKVNVDIKKTAFKPDLWISDEEKGWINQVEQTFGWKGKFWILNAGYKPDNELKKYHRWQEVVDLLNEYFDNKIKIVQIGHGHHNHPQLKNVYNLVGKTDVRQLIRLSYWSEGLMGPLSSQFTIAAALGKPGVVVAGGKEGVNWHIYPNIQHLYTNGTINCCLWDGCWMGGNSGSCKNLIETDVGLSPLCFEMIKPSMIFNSVKMYYEGGVLKF